MRKVLGSLQRLTASLGGRRLPRPDHLFPGRPWAPHQPVLDAGLRGADEVRTGRPSTRCRPASPSGIRDRHHRVRRRARASRLHRRRRPHRPGRRAVDDRRVGHPPRGICHSTKFAREGGTLEMAQLWVNLRAKDKNAPAGYQTLLNRDIPSVGLPADAGQVRIIAGTYAGQSGPARTFSPMDVWDVRLRAGGRRRSICRRTVPPRSSCCAARCGSTGPRRSAMASWCCWIGATAAFASPRMSMRRSWC